MVCIVLFAVMLAAMDFSAYWVARWYDGIRFGGIWQYAVLLMISIYLLSVPAWICLYKLWKLLRNITSGNVFVEANVSLLRAVSWCCAAASLFGLLSAIYYLPFMIIAIAAAFMMLIVRVVKNVFRQAVDMKSELDLTI